MIKEKVSLQEIADLLASKASISKRAAEEFLKVFFQTIEETLVLGEVVKIKNFGTFKMIWNEPRKSVNVQTGEDIMLAGFNKVTFIPDAMLKETVNEPFSHLQAVQLDETNAEPVEVITQTAEIQDPLRNLTEQASEIKNLLQEIQSISNNNVVIPIQNVELTVETVKVVEIPDYEFDNEIVAEQVIIEEPVIVESNSNLVEEAPTLKVESDEIENKQAEIYTPNPFVKNVSKKRKTNRYVWIFSAVLIVVLTLVGLYIYNPVVRLNTNYTVSTVIDITSKWFSTSSKNNDVNTIIVPKKQLVIDSVKTEPVVVDSLQILFDTPRVYPEFIATERINRGSRLARMAKRYYGTSDFWVYIYEANKDRIEHPDRIPANTLIYIPKIDKRLIDANNPRCIKKAKELHDLYVK